LLDLELCWERAPLRTEGDAKTFSCAAAIRPAPGLDRGTRSIRELEPDICTAAGATPVPLFLSLAESRDVGASASIATAVPGVASARSGAEAPVAEEASAGSSTLADKSDPAGSFPAPVVSRLGLCSAGAVATGCDGWDLAGAAAAPVPSSTVAG